MAGCSFSSRVSVIGSPYRHAAWGTRRSPDFIKPARVMVHRYRYVSERSGSVSSDGSTAYRFRSNSDGSSLISIKPRGDRIALAVRHLGDPVQKVGSKRDEQALGCFERNSH